MVKLEKFSVNILAISAAILMLVFALKDLNKLDPIRTVQSLAVVLTMILGLIAAISLLSNTAPQTKSSALTILAIAVSIGILANALEKNRQTESLWQIYFGFNIYYGGISRINRR